MVTLGAALRLENYTDFGKTFNWKVSGRFAPVSAFALRASASTGFRAPSLQQRYFSSTYTDFIGGVASDVVISPNNSAIAQALGIPSLKEETSFNYTVGAVAKAGNFNVTLDVYNIDIEDRIVLTGYFDASDPNLDPEAAEIITRAGASQASFFANAINTNTFGANLVASYRQRFNSSTLMVTLAANYNRTKQVGAVQTTDLLEGFEETFFGERERLFVEGATPNWKGNLMFNFDRQRFGAMLRVNYFGEVIMGTWSGGGLI